ncbi:hypothetical protein A3842_02430 [Paenibacillus sp. P3E]|uniref:hypothetical protein n=1 Tax=Paenibacillus sp. P3E TaxID=1349435 RepID=UPI000964E407|nr:hypothetical protein [Paenibacillus sp. P3E]OKP92287.1 hypothetical protein A3842_02430 [Paenibacillus sp. P3E]
MKIINKLVIFVLVFFLVFSVKGSPTNATGSLLESEVHQNILEDFAVDNLEQHQDVKEYLLSHGYEYYLEQDLNLNQELMNKEQSDIQPAIDNYDLFDSETNESFAGDGDTNDGEIDEPVLPDEEVEISGEKREELIQKYQLDKPEVEEAGYDQNFLVKRDALTKAVSNVWLLSYIPTNTTFVVSVVNLGNDSIDRISGTIKKYNKSKDKWTAVSPVKNFSKASVNSGIVNTWITNRTSVSDYFEYKITVQEDGSTWNYNNTGQVNYQRYNFLGGIFNKMSALGGERHHFVSNDALKRASFNSNAAPAIRMLYRDHLNTPSWGSSLQSDIYRDKEFDLLNAKKYVDLLQMEVDGLKAAKDSEGKYKNLQVKYINEVVEALYLSEIYYGI